MKFEPLVKVENNKIFLISDNHKIDIKNSTEISGKDINSVSIPAEKNKLFAVQIYWEDIELSPEVYDEDYLAQLREFLKNLEESSNFAFIYPKTNKKLETPEDAETFMDAMVHTARRIKDAQSVIGFYIPDEILEKDSIIDENSYTCWFIDKMNKKHSHYVYFINKEKIKNIENAAEIQFAYF